MKEHGIYRTYLNDLKSSKDHNVYGIIAKSKTGIASHKQDRYLTMDLVDESITEDQAITVTLFVPVSIELPENIKEYEYIIKISVLNTTQHKDGTFRRLICREGGCLLFRVCTEEGVKPVPVFRYKIEYTPSAFDLQCLDKIANAYIGMQSLGDMPFERIRNKNTRFNACGQIRTIHKLSHPCTIIIRDCTDYTLHLIIDTMKNKDLFKQGEYVRIPDLISVSIHKKIIKAEVQPKKSLSVIPLEEGPIKNILMITHPIMQSKILAKILELIKVQAEIIPTSRTTLEDILSGEECIIQFTKTHPLYSEIDKLPKRYIYTGSNNPENIALDINTLNRLVTTAKSTPAKESTISNTVALENTTNNYNQPYTAITPQADKWEDLDYVNDAPLEFTSSSPNQVDCIAYYNNVPIIFKTFKSSTTANIYLMHLKNTSQTVYLFTPQTR
ncbi:hypothetical protein NEOKW01_1185 [Nematocida sp. AWRm80]|nr:hypothetical protein NEOKW01_1185 [Nematocida sp. AWRm80]